MYTNDIYIFADSVSEQLGRYSPLTQDAWLRPRLADFDLNEVGTKAQLEQRRCDYERDLEPRWIEYRDALWVKQNDLMIEFTAALAKEFLPMLPHSITDKVYDRAWDEGHSSGLREIVNVYQELANFVDNLLKDYVEFQGRLNQEPLFKG
jgi:hypothetical protein